MKIGDVELHEGTRVIVEYDPQLHIIDFDHMSARAGARYLEVLPVHTPQKQLVYIAMGWCNETFGGAAFIDFPNPSGGT